MDYPYAETGERILQLCRAQNLTREQLAELADISVQFLADIEKGKKSMTVATLRKIAHALQISTDFIVNGTGEVQEQTLLQIYEQIPASQRGRAVEILRTFCEAVNEA